MSATPQMDRLVARFEKMKAEGLRDFKFTLDPTKPTGTAEELAAELNDVLDAVDAGEYTDMPPIGDSKLSEPERTGRMAEIARRRFGRDHDKPCERPETLTCAMWACQVRDRCVHAN